MNSDTYYYKKGANQLFSQATHIFDPTLYMEEDLIYNTDKEVCINEVKNRIYLHICTNVLNIQILKGIK